MPELSARIAGLEGKYDRAAAELKELRRSYYFSGAAKKVDLRELEGFSDIVRKVLNEGRSGMNFDRFHVLWQAVLGGPPGFPIVEVGTYLGGSARFITEALDYAGRSPRFYVCDSFAGHPRTDAELDARHHEVNKFSDTSAESVREYLADYDDLELVVGDIVETSATLTELTFGFVHIDVDVHAATEFCLRFFAPRLAPGAVIVLDDYGVTTCPGVQKAADEFVAAATEYRLFHLLSGQAIVYRTA